MIRLHKGTLRQGIKLETPLQNPPVRHHRRAARSLYNPEHQREHAGVRESSGHPNILCSPLVNNFGLLGGSVNTICLIIATFLFSKYKASRSIAELSAAPGLFNINEPVIFGYPIVFNIALIIPFVLMPTIGITIGYYTTLWGWMNPSVVFTPWTTPPILNAYLATGGDWRAVVIQLAVIALGVLIYLPFMKLSEKIQSKSAGMDE